MKKSAFLGLLCILCASCMKQELNNHKLDYRTGEMSLLADEGAISLEKAIEMIKSSATGTPAGMALTVSTATAASSTTKINFQNFAGFSSCTTPEVPFNQWAIKTTHGNSNYNRSDVRSADGTTNYI